MSAFRNVLVGIDLSRCTSPAFDALGSIAQEATRRAIWVARETGATLTFFSALDEAGQAWHLIEEEDRAPAARTVDAIARQALAGLVQQAREQGVTAHAHLVPGDGRTELLRQVEREHHDLVIVGTREVGRLRRILFGSTAQKLLHHCPCSVWVNKPGAGLAPLQVLVANDLTLVGERALDAALAVGNLAGGTVHLLHVVEYPLDRLWTSGLPDERRPTYHARVRTDAEQALAAQIERHGGKAAKCVVKVHIADSDGLADHAILQFIHDHAIDLLVLGSVAREGLAGVLLGNSAERLLPEVPCSVLAVKAPGPEPRLLD